MVLSKLRKMLHTKRCKCSCCAPVAKKKKTTKKKATKKKVTKKKATKKKASKKRK